LFSKEEIPQVSCACILWEQFTLFLGNGSGGVSAFGGPFKDEFDTRILHSHRGVLSMANSGPNSNGSQFFITLNEAKHLDLKHSVFGRVVGGAAVLDTMEEVSWIFIALSVTGSKFV
jgi:cyclophilin family peptidyl-prolyl cis-trans isomerase